MKKLLLTLTVWLFVFFVISTPIIMNQKNKVTNKNYFVDENTEIRQITGVQTYDNGMIEVRDDYNKDTLIEKPAMTIQENVPIVDQYKDVNGDYIPCTENLVFKMVYKPGKQMQVIDVLDSADEPKNKTVKKMADNIIIAGQGFDMQVLLSANLSAAVCRTKENLQLLYDKVTANDDYYEGTDMDNLAITPRTTPPFEVNEQNVTMYVAITPSEKVNETEDAKFLTGRAVDPRLRNSASLWLRPWAAIDADNNGTFSEVRDDITATGFTVKYLIDPAWAQTGSTNTEYTDIEPENGWEKMGKLGYYYTKFSSCPKTVNNTTPVFNSYVLEYAYSPGGTYATPLPNNPGFLSQTKYGYAVGEYLVAQQLLVAGTQAACINDTDTGDTDEIALKNNFYYTTIDLEDPFNKQKFSSDSSLLNWEKYWTEADGVSPSEKWASLYSRSAGNAVTNKYIDFSDAAGPDRLKALAEEYKKAPYILIGEYSESFSQYRPGDYNN